MSRKTHALSKVSNNQQRNFCFVLISPPITQFFPLNGREQINSILFRFFTLVGDVEVFAYLAAQVMSVVAIFQVSDSGGN